MDKLVLIDGNSLLNRAFYATPVFSTRDGRPTNAIFGFIKLLFKVLSDVKPQYLIVAFDLKAPTFRHKMFDGYKATRKPMPDELAAQVEPLKELLAEMHIAMCSKEGLEADDIIGTLSNKFDVHSYIYTGDRDSYQLVDEKTDVCFTRKGVSDLIKLNAGNFRAEVGLDPAQIVDLKALMGDKSDNIPGVPGIGEKTARGLIEKYGSLDGVYANLGEIKGAVKTKLEDNRQSAYLSYKLAKIDRNCDIDIDISVCTPPQRFSAAVKKMFSAFEFRSLLKEDIFEEVNGAEEGSVNYPELIKDSSAEQFFAAAKAADGRYFVVFGDCCLHVWFGKEEHELSLSASLLDDYLDHGQFVSCLKFLFSDDTNTIIIDDFKSAMHSLAGFGVECRCKFEDLSLIVYLCGESGGETLKKLCDNRMLDYNCRAFCVGMLYEEYKKSLEESGCMRLYEEIEKPLVKVLYDMETEGVTVSSDELEKLGKKYSAIIAELTAEIHADCGCEFNINSPSQLGEVLFEKLGLKSGKRGRNGKYSTNADILEKLAEENPVAGKVLRFRFYQKLLSTYIDGMRPFIGKDGLIHTTYNQTITATGRLSSANPNLQNIPVREEEGKELRKVFIPRSGNVFIDADYSQIELRLLAHFSGCKELIQAYNEGKDIHSITASQVFGVAPEDVTPKMRREAKAVNFGIIYGISEYGLARNLGIPFSTAKEYIERYFATYSAVKDYMNTNVEFAREHGYVSTLTGRRRFIPELKSANVNIRQFGERAAMNMPLQGSSADIIKIAMINVERRLQSEGLHAKLILQVHDELVLDCPLEEKDRAAELLRHEMENAVKLEVPLTVEVHSGNNWYDAK
ncbi:MAG TPA: DNA polymerase I [Candidatus Coproplasma avistercoris]|nr:DNA polymerase I [Candidatus Coproplasma avistercoris]